MSKLRDPKVRGALRHLLTAFGPVIAIIMSSDDPVQLIRDVINGPGWGVLVGFIMAVIGFWTSWTAKEKQ